MKWMLVYALLDPSWPLEKTHISLDKFHTEFEDHESCYQMGQLMTDRAVENPKLKFTFDCLGYDDGWF